jgi:hypothetical protein
LRTQTTNCFDGGLGIAGPHDFGNFAQNLEVHQRSVSKSRDRVNGGEIVRAELLAGAIPGESNVLSI